MLFYNFQTWDFLGKSHKEFKFVAFSLPQEQLSVTTDLLISELMVRLMTGLLATSRNPEKTFASHSRLCLLDKIGGNVLHAVA